MTRWLHIAAAVILTALLIIMPDPIVGQEKEPYIKYLKKYDPDVLALFSFLDDDCPGTRQSYEKIIEGELLRARIKRGSYKNEELYLGVTVECTVGNGTQGYSVDIYYGFDYTVVDAASDELGFYSTRFGSGYGFFGYGSSIDTETTISDALRRSVSDALTDFLKANFDQ